MKVGLLLTQWKRPYLERQLKAIDAQTLKPDYIIVFQNENHVDISSLKDKYNFIHVKSDYNTKFFGRFAYFFTLPVDICIVMDDDIVPAVGCIENYVTQCNEKNAIIGGNGRIGLLNLSRNKLTHPPECGPRRGIKVDFVGHLWCFKKEWLHYMFGVAPCTYDTGEDMQLCFSAKLNAGIESYVGAQQKNNGCDSTKNGLAADKYASFRTTSSELRKSVEQYWLDKGLKLITKN